MVYNTEYQNKIKNIMLRERFLTICGIPLNLFVDGNYYYHQCYDTYHCITFSQAKNPLLTDEDEQIAFEIIDVRILNNVVNYI